MPSQQAADKNGIQISSKTHTRVQELLRRGTMSASKAGMESPAILLIYDPKHIRKSKLVKGIGAGVQPQNLDFLGFYICYSPGFLVFRMGSFVSQLCTVAEI